MQALAALAQSHAATNTKLVFNRAMARLGYAVVRADTLSELTQGELGRVRSERDGYRKAYEAAAAENGRLRNCGASLPRNGIAPVGDKPSVLVVTLPRSGTIYIGSTLQQSLHYDYGPALALGHFDKNVIVPEVAHDFRRGGLVCTTHLQPDQTNISVLHKFGITKGVLQTRDPRAALRGWMNYYSDDRLYRLLDPHLIDCYTKLSPMKKFEHHLQRYFIPALAWLSDWLNCLEAERNLEFLSLTFDELAEHEHSFFGKIFDFYGLRAVLKPAQRNSQTHFRGGSKLPWREEFSADQIRRMNELIPSRLWERFGWTE